MTAFDAIEVHPLRRGPIGDVHTLRVVAWRDGVATVGEIATPASGWWHWREPNLELRADPGVAYAVECALASLADAQGWR